MNKVTKNPEQEHPTTKDEELLKNPITSQDTQQIYQEAYKQGFETGFSTGFDKRGELEEEGLPEDEPEE